MAKKTTKSIRSRPKGRTSTPKLVVRRDRTIAIITGLKAGNPKDLAPQPLALVNVAFELGRTDRRTFLGEAEKLIETSQRIGRLFSFHTQTLVKKGYIKYEKIPRPQWQKELDKRKVALASALPDSETSAGV